MAFPTLFVNSRCFANIRSALCSLVKGMVVSGLVLHLCIVVLNYELLILVCAYQLALYMLAAFAVSTIYLLFGLQSKFAFFSVYAHEHTHALFALLFFNKILEIKVRKFEGHVGYRGTSNWLISLSPYFFPLGTATLLLVSLVISSNYQFLLKYLVAVSYVLFFVNLKPELRLAQSDIQNTGVWFSVLVITLANIFVATFVYFYLNDASSYYCNMFTSLFSPWYIPQHTFLPL